MDAREARGHRDGRRDGAAHGRARVLLVAGLILLAAAACGGGDDVAVDPPEGEGGGGEPPAVTTELTVTFWPEGREGPVQEATLTCDPPGGTHPRAEQACTVLSGNADALAPVPTDALCTQIYGGPEEAELAGTLLGERIRASFSRTNGCEINRWERLAPVLQLDGG